MCASVAFASSSFPFYFSHIDFICSIHPIQEPMRPSSQEEISQNSGTTRTKSSSNTKQQQTQQQPLKCPRCDSTNTKFCYYNNYCLTQPRHFCKTCRRYWTKGGALRNVPIGGGCRKTKKLKSSSSSSSSNNSKLLPSGDTPAFRFFAGISPSIDFQLNGGLGVGLSSSSPQLFPTTPTTNHPYMSLNYDTNFPLIHHHNTNSNLNLQPHYNTNTTLASSIQSLSSLNQDLHSKLQQHRLAMIFGDHDHVQNKDQNHKLLQPILFHNLETPKQDSCFNIHDPRTQSAAASTTGEDATTTEWFFGNNSYDDRPNHHQVSATNSAGANGWNHTNNNNGVQAWEDLHHFTALP